MNMWEFKHTQKIWSVNFKTIFLVVVLYVMTILPQSMIVVVVFSQSTKNDTKNCYLVVVATLYILVHTYLASR